MFSGIIEESAKVESIKKTDKGARLAVKTKVCAVDAKIGDSISINGVCLTIAAIKGKIASFDISGETLEKTSLGRLRAGDSVNMERALKIDSRLGGHFVTGHVDGVGKIITKNKNGDFIEMEIEIATHLMKYLAQKGSVAVDGISLTIAAVAENTFRVILIPHTISVTTLAYKKAADIVNIETDILAKYVQQAINPSLEQSASKKYRPITRELLLDYGFIPPANTQD